MTRSSKQIATLSSFLIILMLAGFSCRHSDGRLGPFGWTSTDAEFDSLTVGLERAYYGIAPDSVLHAMTSRMGELARRDPSRPEKMSRYHYWNSRLKLRRHDVEGAMDGFAMALALTDSSKYPYDVARIRWNMELEEPYGVEGYNYGLSRAELFRKFGDLPMEAYYKMHLGTIMNDVGNQDAALDYFKSADSLLRLSGLDGQSARNMINIATTIHRSGRVADAVAILKHSLSDSMFCSEPVAVNIAQWNLYLFTDSLPMLQKAYAGLEGDPQEGTMRALYGSHLIKEYAARGMTDSVRTYIARVEPDTLQLGDEGYLRDYYIGRAAGEHALGNDSRAYAYADRAIRLMQALEEDQEVEEVKRMSQARMIEEVRHRLEIARRDRTVVFLGVLIGIILIAGGVVIFYHRRFSRQREKRLEASLAQERAERRVLALEIAMEENRQLGSDLLETVDSLERHGQVTPEAIGRLEATLKSHDATRGAQDSFVEVFSQVNPKFLEALDRTYPTLSKAERRLATYIALELDNKHIARLTGTRPESVKQGRWRLRQKLNLPEGVTLEDEMRRLGELREE